MPTPVNVGGAPTTMGPAGYWLDAQGNVAATDPQGNPQVTPGMRDNPQAAIYYDADKDLYYNLVNGRKQYQSPYAYNQGGQTLNAKGTGHGMTNPGSSLFKTGGTWNPDTGQFEQGTNWSNILSLGVGGALTGGLIDALASGGAAAGGAGAAAGAPAGGVGAGVNEAALAAQFGGGGAGAATGAGVGAGIDDAALAAQFGGGGGAASLGGAAGAIPSSIPLSDVNAVTLPGQAAASIPWSKLIAPLLGTGTGIVNAVLGSNAAKTAAQQEIAGAQQAIGTLSGLYQDAQKRYAPYQASGQAALGSLNNLLGLKVQ